MRKFISRILSKRDQSVEPVPVVIKGPLPWLRVLPLVGIAGFYGYNHFTKNPSANHVEALECASSRSSTPHVAVVRVNGSLGSDFKLDEFRKTIQSIARNSRYTAIVLDIDSPGGRAYDSMEMHKIMMDARRNCHLPVIALGGNLVASGAYMLAMSAEHVYARNESSIIGSVGVIASVPNFSGLMERHGVQMIEIKTSPRKASGSPFVPFSDEARQTFERMMTSIQTEFWNIVEEGRHGKLTVSRETILDADVYPASQAIQMGMIDGIEPTVDSAVRRHFAGARMTVFTPENRTSIVSRFLGSANAALNIAETVTGTATANQPGMQLEYRLR